jgi:hypothetical protein
MDHRDLVVHPGLLSYSMQAIFEVLVAIQFSDAQQVPELTDRLIAKLLVGHALEIFVIGDGEFSP